MREKLLDYLNNSEIEQFQLLEKLILQSSHTLDKGGVDKVGHIISEALADCSLNLRVEKVADRGNNLVFRSAACTADQPQLLLAGHMDTVFSQKSPFNFFKIDENKAYGPGIIDMKGGLVTAIFLLKGLQSQNLLNEIPIVLICNSDEEMGSTHSSKLIREEAAKSLCAFVFECGGLNGEIVTGRKGKSGYLLEVFGKAGHAAFTGRNGKASAILELAHKTIHIENLNDPQKQIVANVGQVEGGTAANVVADKASAQIDTRFVKCEDGIFCQQNIEKITMQCSTPHTRASLTTTSSRPPMEQSQKNKALFEIVKKQAEHLSMELAEELRSGVSDANTIAECGVAVLDGLGPVGDLDHSQDEYMIKNTLVQRCKLAALSVLDIWERQRQGELSL
jgi:glutamate carboxypeptidase